jgi:hypothetical protein
VEEFIPLLHQSPVPPAENLARNLGLSAQNLPSVLRSLGYVLLSRGGITRYIKRKPEENDQPALDPAKAADILKAAWGQ